MEKLEFHEVVEQICKVAKVRYGSKTIKDLKCNYKNLYTLFNSEDLSLVKNERLKEVISMVKQFAILYEQTKIQDMEKINNAGEVVKFLRTSIGNNRDEEFIVIFLNSMNKILAIESMSKGIVNKSAVYPRKVAELGLKYNAVSVILAHNHPSGTNKPSENDIKATEIVIKALKVLDMNVLDHIIIAQNNYYSFKDNGLI